MSGNESRWKQRLSNYRKALMQLNKAVQLSQERPLSDLEQQGLIQSFEFSHKLAWKVMKDYFFYQGNSEITGSRDATREAFKAGLISKGEVWMDMISSRNRTSDTYDEGTANELVEKIIGEYVSLMNDFRDRLSGMGEREL